MTPDQKTAYRTKWNEIEKEFDAIEAGAFAAVLMLRKLKSSAVELHKSATHEGPEETIQQLNRIRDSIVHQLHRSRLVLGHLIEDVGNFMDGSDLCEDRDVDLVAPVFALMQSFPDNLAPIPPAFPEDQQ